MRIQLSKGTKFFIDRTWNPLFENAAWDVFGSDLDEHNDKGNIRKCLDHYCEREDDYSASNSL